MTDMKKNVLIWGCGSIGLRHARLAADMGASVYCISSKTDLPYPTASSFAEIPATWIPDVAIVATPTALHGRHVATLRGAGISCILVEKPVAATLAQAQPLEQADADGLLVAYNLRFHPGIQRLREILHGKKLLALLLQVGQYLPSWRPEQDYRQSYSASTELGGGVLRDLSHELDLACLFAGPWQRVTALSDKVSDLEICSEDCVTLIAEHSQCPQVSVHLNYLETPGNRKISAVWENGGATLDMVAGTLRHGNTEEHFTVDRDGTYRSQMQALLTAEHDICCTYEQGLEVVAYIEAAERAAILKEWVWRSPR